MFKFIRKFLNDQAELRWLRSENERLRKEYHYLKKNYEALEDVYERLESEHQDLLESLHEQKDYFDDPPY